MDRIIEGRPKNNSYHYEGEILALFDIHHFFGRMFFFSQFKVKNLCKPHHHHRLIFVDVIYSFL